MSDSMSKEVKCLITGWAATSYGNSHGWYRFSSPTAGGDYEATPSAVATLEGGGVPKDVRQRLVSWLVKERLSGVLVPRITTERLVPEALPRRATVAERLERLYRFLRWAAPALGKSLPYDVNGTKVDSDRWPSATTNAYLRAWTDSEEPGEVVRLVEFATQEGLVTAGVRIQLTVKGWQHLERLDLVLPDTAQAFVAMWFSEVVDGAFRDGIEPAIRERGFDALRIDRKEHNNKIDDEIIAEIRRSRFVVADFTCGTHRIEGSDRPVFEARGGVYYEAGFAQGLGIPVIWTCRADQIGAVHFDTRQFNHITWSSPGELREKLSNRIGAIFGHGPNALA